MGHDSDLALDVVAVRPHGLAEHLDLAVIVVEQLQQAVYRGRLSGSVWADKTKDLSSRDVQREVVHGNDLAIALDEVADADDGL